MKDLNALVYLRVSTEEQAGKGYSIPAQRMEGMNRAVELGCSPEDIYIFSDEGVSGAVLERPQLMAALDMLKKKYYNIGFFICYDSSRLSRNAAHQLIIIDEIKKSGAKLIFIRNNYQDNAEGRFQLTVMAAVDEYERARLRLRTEMGKIAKAAQNKLTHNPGIYGYNFNPKTDTLNVNEEHAQNLKLIFEMAAEEHKGPAEIAEILNATEIPSPRMKQWSRVTVRRIISNSSYLGTLYIRRYDTKDYHLNKFKKKNEKVKIREKPRSEWVPVQIPKIIDKEIWEKAQKTLKESKHIRKKGGKTNFLLTPLLRCGICGRIINGKSIVKEESAYRYYICTGKYKDMKESKCDAMLIRAENIEKAVWDYISEDIYFFMRNELDLSKTIKKYVSDKEDDIKNIFIKKEKANDERERIMIMYQKGYISEDEMDDRLKINLEKIMKFNAEAVQRSKEDLSFLEKLENDWRENRVFNIIEETISRLDIEDRRLVIDLLISEITVANNAILIKRRL
ncbi:MAG TPA: recombinase family protein [Bacillota bacterium]|nr:recombinase family protein [Bacillota bacterium]